MAALAHSLNSRGELGMFVNPYDCSCTTCHEYLADRQEESDEAACIPPLPLQEIEAADSLILLNRILMAGTQFETPPRSPSVARTLSFSPPPVLRSMTGFHYTPSPREDTGTLPASPPPSVPEEIVLQPAQAKIIYDGLTDYIQMLRIQQDKVYDQTSRSHDEMAAQDMEFEELDRKIAEIDDILQVLEVE